jgi:hypothetical protein
MLQGISKIAIVLLSLWPLEWSPFQGLLSGQLTASYLSTEQTMEVLSPYEIENAGLLLRHLLNAADIIY